jgi:hypothetical protein
MDTGAEPLDEGVETQALALFEAALGVPHDARAAFLAARAPGPAVLARVLELLGAGGAADTALLDPRLTPRLAAGTLELGGLAAGLDAPAARGIHRPFGPDTVIGGDFLIEGEIGAGGGGVVYRARQLSLRRDVALKVRQVLGLSERACARFRREAATLAALRHPHVVEVYQFGEDAALGVLFYAMRLVPGPMLAALRDRGGARTDAELRQAVTLCAEVGEALAALHRADPALVHGDVKPENVVIEERADVPCAVLVDFGLAREEASATVTAAGTFGYAAPEQLAGLPTDARSDVYALGACLCDVLTGGRPLPGVPASARVRAALAGTASAAVEPWPAELAAVVAEATAEEPGRRYPDGAALAADLRAWLAGCPVAAATPRSRLRRRRRLVAACFAVAVPVAAFAAAGTGIGRARAALAKGDLLLHARIAAALPAPLRALASPRPRASGSIQDVLDVLARRGLEAALVRAAGHVQRRGYSAEPELLRFLCVAMDGDPGGLVPLQVASRMVMEQPVRERQAAKVTAPLRLRFGVRLAAALSPEEAAAALAGLAGCGEASDLWAMRAWLWDTVRTGGTDSVDEVRLALRCMESLVARQRTAECWRQPPLNGFAAWLRDLTVMIEGLPEWVTGAQASSALAGLGHAALVASRAAGAGLALADVLEAGVPASAVGLAAGHDPQLRGKLDAPDAGIAAVLGLPHGRTATTALLYGLCVGLYADEALVRRASARLPQLAACGGYTEAAAQAGFAAGLEGAAAMLAGATPGSYLDADTHLVAEASFESRPRPLAVAPSAEPPARDVLAEWSCRDGAVRLGGTAGVPVGDHATVTEDGPGDCFIRLGLRGASSVVLPFSAGDLSAPLLSVELEVQKGLRELLPQGGQATLDVELDGEDYWRDAKVAGSLAKVVLNLDAYDARLTRRLLLRLGTSSTTTLRIYSVRVRG